MSQLQKEPITKTYSLRRKLQSINPVEKQDFLEPPSLIDPNPFFDYEMSISRKQSKNDDCFQISLTKNISQEDEEPNTKKKFTYQNINQFAFNNKIQM